jgi:hypothetical protein
MENESTVEPLPATTEQSDEGMTGNSMSQAEHIALLVKQATAKKAEVAEPVEATGETETDATTETEEATEVADTEAEGTETGDKPAEDEHSDDEPDTEDDTVLSKSDKILQEKFQKRIGKITAKRKEAESRVAELEAKLAAQTSEAPEPQVVVAADDPSDKTATALREEDLTKIETDARNTVDFVEANDKAIMRAIARDEPTVTLGGREFNVDELRDFAKQAKRHLERYIPARRQWLARNTESVAQAKTYLPSLFEKSSAEHQEFTAYMRKNPALRNVPDAERLFALAKVGERYLKEKGDKKPAVTAKASAVAPRAGADTGAAAATAKPRGNTSGAKAKLQGELGQAQKRFQSSGTQQDYQQVLILQDRLKKL